MKRVLWLLMVVPFLLACGFLQGLSRMKQSVEFYATQLPQTLESQRPTLEAVATQIAPVVETATAVVATPQAGNEGEPPSSGSGFVLQGYVSELEHIRSGRERFTSVLIMGDQRFTLLDVEHRFDRDQKAEAWFGTFNDEEIRVIVREGRTWLFQDDQWIIWSGDPEEVLLSPALPEWGGSRDILEEVGRERIAGLEVIRYRLRGVEPPPLTREDLQVPGVPPLAGEPQVQSFEAHVWITPDGYLAKILARWEVLLPLQNGQQQPATVEFLFEALDINQPVDIPVPEMASQVPEAPLPMPEDAQFIGQISQPPTWQYQVPSWDLETGVDYIQQALQSQNFQIKEHQVLPGMAVFRVVSPEGQSWEIVLTPAVSGQGVLVNIIGTLGP